MLHTTVTKLVADKVCGTRLCVVLLHRVIVPKVGLWTAALSDRPHHVRDRDVVTVFVDDDAVRVEEHVEPVPEIVDASLWDDVKGEAPAAGRLSDVQDGITLAVAEVPEGVTVQLLDATLDAVVVRSHVHILP